MDSTVILQKREEIKVAMDELCKSAEKDKALCEKIKDRGFWARLFANNTRDLAKAGIAQVELIEKLQLSVQDLMQIIKDANERERQMTIIIDELRTSGDEAIRELRDDLGKTIRVILKEDLKVERMESVMKSACDINASKSATQKCISFLTEYCKNASDISGEEFCKHLRQCIEENFKNKNIALRNEDKQFLIQNLGNIITNEIEYDQGFGCEKLPIRIIAEMELEKLSPEGDKYMQFRDELVGMIDEFVTHKSDVDPQGKSIQKLEEVKTKLLESQFEIALIGEFQGGKSTTFNALCGGREISPRGLGTGGVKTSAAVITAQNIAGNEQRNGMNEWAEITWLPKKNLQQRIAEALNYDENKPLPSISELDEAIKTAWKNLPTDNDDARDLLQVATLQLRLIKSEEYDTFAARNIVAIDEFQKYVKFPKNWEMRWGEKGIDADFSIEESLFAALDSVLVRIHSEHLGKLGCQITDCPGLFVSKWDTSRALKVMSRSNAVWYLMNGNKEMGQDQKNVLKYIRQAEWHPKCFFTLNVKGDETSTEGILRANVAKIKNAGFNVENRVFKYNAAVAFRLAQLEYVKTGKFGKRDIDCLAIESANKRNKYDELLEKFSTDDGPERIKAIRQLIYNVLIPTGYSDSAHSSMTDEELASDLENFAGLKNIVRSLEKHVISHKASSILLGDSGSGAELCKKVLDELCKDKKAEEEAAKQSVAEAKQKWEKDEKNFSKFNVAVEKEFRFLTENTNLDNLFLNDFYDKNYAEIKNEVSASAIDITIEEWHGNHWTNNDVKNSAVRKIKEEFSTFFKLKLDAYGKAISSTPIYKKEIDERITLSWKDLKDEWEEISKNNPHFDGLCPDDEVVNVEISPFNETIDQSIEIPSYFLEFFRNIGDCILSIFGAKRVTSEDKIRNFFREQDPIGKALDTMKESSSRSQQFRDLFAQARTANKEKIDSSIAESMSKFKERIQKEKEDFALSDSVRQQKAEEAKRVREQIIEPRMTTIADFVNRVKAAYGN